MVSQVQYQTAVFDWVVNFGIIWGFQSSSRVYIFCMKSTFALHFYVCPFIRTIFNLFCFGEIQISSKNIYNIDCRSELFRQKFEFSRSKKTPLFDFEWFFVRFVPRIGRRSWLKFEGGGEKQKKRRKSNGNNWRSMRTTHALGLLMMHPISIVGPGRGQTDNGRFYLAR